MNMHAIERQITFPSQINLITLYLKKLQHIHFMATRCMKKNGILASYLEACNTVIFYTCKINDLPVI